MEGSNPPASSSANELEQVFLSSWDEVTSGLRPVPGSWFEPVSLLITQLRARGYDRVFRAGTAAWFFVMSRSRHHGLRAGQHSIDIRTFPNWPEIYFVYNVGQRPWESVRLLRAEITADVERLLARLAAQPID